MQRWLFLFFLLNLAPLLPGQLLSHTELSYWFCRQAPDCAEIRGEVSYRLQAVGNRLELQAARHLNINSVRLRQGRLKDSLRFEHSHDQLLIELNPDWQEQVLELDISFKFSTTDLDEQQFQQSEDFIAFHPYKLYGQPIAAPAGYFFPGFRAKASPLSINLSFPDGQNSGTPGTLSFITDNGDGTISHYWDSYAQYTPGDFFLIVGHFDEFEPQELREDFEFVVIDTRRLKADGIAATLEALMTFSGESRPNDSILLLIDSLADLETDAGYIRSADLSDFSVADYRLMQSYARHGLKLKEEPRQKLLLNFFSARYGADWLTDIHQQRWQQRDTLAVALRRQAIAARFRRYLQANPWLKQEFDTNGLQLTFRDSLIKTMQAPHFSVSFHYVAADEQLYLNYYQDSNIAPAYPIPVQVLLVTREDSSLAYSLLPEAEGRVGIPLTSSPYYLDLDPGAYFPGSFEQQKPDSYLLYALAKSSNQQSKRTALLALFETENPRLFSTALGIAMDDEEASIRLAALRHASQLDPAAQQKLKSSLLNLSENDPDQQVQNLARNLVEKYYEGK